jgi:hypothetical protein
MRYGYPADALATSTAAIGRPVSGGANQEREALPVTSDEKGALPVARRRKLVAAALLASAMDNTETASAPRAQLRSGRNSTLS